MSKTRIARDNYDLRDLKSSEFAVSPPAPALLQFCDEFILPHLDLSRRRKKADRVVMISAIIRECVARHFQGRCVRLSRDKKLPGVSLRNDMIEVLNAAGLIRVCLGSKTSRCTTRIAPTQRLLQLRGAWSLDLFSESENHDSHPNGLRFIRGVYRHEQDKTRPSSVRDSEPLKNPPARSKLSRQLRQVNADLTRINDYIRLHTFAISIDDITTAEVSAELTQIHSGAWGRICRLYTRGLAGGQQLRKVVRAGMTIDGHPTVELDFSCMHPRLLYNRVGVRCDFEIYNPLEIFPQLSPFLVDVSSSLYRGARSLLKLAVNVALNCSDQLQAERAFRSELNDSDNRSLASLRILDRSGLDVRDLFDVMTRCHEPINQFFFNEASVDLMKLESEIMLQILNRCVDEEIPMLAIHDGIRVPKDRCDAARKIMFDAYLNKVGFEPVIKSSEDTDNGTPPVPRHIHFRPALYAEICSVFDHIDVTHR